ncbi:hypothetical protein RQP46_004107 [Phenoliferia psychrophenolica]
MSSATSRPPTPLVSLLEESAPAAAGQSNGHSTPLDEPESSEPIPTLASLLLSTAEGLAARFREPAPTATAFTPSPAPPRPPPPPAFALPASPETLISDKNSTEYLASLLGLPLASLQALPSSLATLSTSLDTDLSSLAFTRYSSFLLSHAATQSISSSFSTLSSELGSLLDSTSQLEVASGAFESRVHEVRRKRERMARVRERMEEVEELLEASSVVDACVRAGYWTEAIDVASRLAELHNRLSSARDDSEDPNSGKGALLLLDRVRDEVSLALLALRARVLESLLQRGLKLPAAVRGVGILRRMNAGGLGLEGIGGDSHGGMGEEALRIVFLAARWRCLRAELDSVEGQMAASGITLVSNLSSSQNGHHHHDDSAVGPEENDERTRWAKRWIELWREVVGETIGMYTEVFLAGTAYDADDSSAESLSPTAPLSLFLASSLSALSATLIATLPAITSTASLSSLLTQLSYCSHSFARYGLEFREIEQIRERVERRVGVIIVAELEGAGQRWEKEWRDGWEGGIRRRGRDRQALAQWLVVPEGLATALSTPLPPPPDETASAAWHHQPSPSLSLLPPLARFLNAHATALNSLRLLPAISLFPVLRQAQGRALERATKVLAAFVDAWAVNAEAHAPPQDLDLDSLSSEERAAELVRTDEKLLIGFAIAAFGRWVVPWCEGALRVGVYGALAGTEDVVGTALVQDAMRKAEALVARVEGREPVPEEVTPPAPEPSASSPIDSPVESPLEPSNDLPPPPPALEPELVLPPSLDPSLDPSADAQPPPPSEEISFEPSLEPTLERTEELVPEPFVPAPEVVAAARPVDESTSEYQADVAPIEDSDIPVEEDAVVEEEVAEAPIPSTKLALAPTLDDDDAAPSTPPTAPSSPPRAPPFTILSESPSGQNGATKPKTNGVAKEEATNGGKADGVAATVGEANGDAVVE